MRLLAVIATSFVLAVSGARAENLKDCAKGTAAMEAGNHDAAIDELTRCIELGGLSDRNLAAASNNRAFIYLIKGDYDQAIRDFDVVIRLNPSSARAYRSRCWTNDLMRRPDQALADCSESLRLSVRGTPIHSAAARSPTGCSKSTKRHGKTWIRPGR